MALANGKGSIGVLFLREESMDQKSKWQTHELRDKDIVNIRNQVGIQRIVVPFYPQGGWLVVFPHWFVILLAALLAISTRPAPRFKFSLRDLLTLTTVAALTIGPLAFWLRSIR
jgi:hypothetical protein